MLARVHVHANFTVTKRTPLFTMFHVEVFLRQVGRWSPARVDRGTMLMFEDCGKWRVLTPSCLQPIAFAG